MASYQQALLLGTARLASTPEPPHPAIADAWSTGEWKDRPETALLEASALFASARVAGAQPAAALAPVAPAPVETRAAAPEPAAALLTRLLDGELRALLVEWLDVCARAQRVVPHLLLPRLLREVTRSERIAFAAVAGTRGAWLAAQNPEWNWLVNPEEAPTRESWDTGSPAQRIATLHAMRREHPSTAREWLEEVWKSEPAEFRIAALATFATGLSLDDEDFLDPRLSDRRREIRQQAQQLLARMPESRFAQRMRSRADAMLEYRRGLLGGKLQVTEPSAFDPSWKADGIEENAPAGTGEKAFWLRQLLGLVPVGHWLRTFQLTPPELVRAARANEWGPLLIDAWLHTLAFSPEPGLAAALFEPVVLDERAHPPGMSTTALVGLLLEACTEPERWELAVRYGGDAATAWACLPHLHNAPSPDVARTVLHHIARSLHDGTVPGGTPSAITAARAFPIALLDEANRLLERDGVGSRAGESFLQALELRAAIHAAFHSSATNQPDRHA